MRADTPHLTPVDFSALPGWEAAELQQAFAAFRRSAREILQTGRGFLRDTRFSGTIHHWEPACRAALTEQPNPSSYFLKYFRPFLVEDPSRPEGLITGYYEAEGQGSLIPNPAFLVPIYKKPPELVTLPKPMPNGRRYGQILNGEPAAYFTRLQIEVGGALSNRNLELVWLSNWADAFFIHIQGSGRVHLKNGDVMRLAYAGKNGEAYQSIAHELIEQGQISRDEMSMQSLRSWIARNPDEGLALMRRNPSFIFFRMAPIEDPQLGPPGAEQVQLTPRHSLAVDRAMWAFGTPFFIDSQIPHPRGVEPFQDLLIAQDTGSAIKGAARGDVFWGAGEEAAHIAGHLKSPARFYALLPNGFAP
jgi:membrane-bound lytic murein transglycosylase A